MIPVRSFLGQMMAWPCGVCLLLTSSRVPFSLWTRMSQMTARRWKTSKFAELWRKNHTLHRLGGYCETGESLARAFAQLEWLVMASIECFLDLNLNQG